MAGVEETGFVLKRLPEILTELRQEAVEIFQDLVPPGEVVDTSDSSTIGRLIALVTPSLTDLWEAAQEDYAAFDPNSATGIALDNLVAYSGIVRQGETFTTASTLHSGDLNTFIQAGSVVSAPDTNEQFTVVSGVALTKEASSGITVVVASVLNSTAYTITYAGTSTTQTVTYTSDGSATEAEILAGLNSEIISSHPTLSSSVVGNTLVVDRIDVFQTVNFSVTTNLTISKVRKIGEVVASVSGPIEQQANTITTIVTPVLGWDGVTNPVAATAGRLRETDEELRLRFRNTKFERATNTIDAIYSAILNVEGVEEAVVYENDTDVTDVNGVPPHSFLPIVTGGLSTDIANSIWENKPIGILSFGNTTVAINDVQGFSHDISFSRPDPIVIYIEIPLVKDGDYPANGDDLMRSALIEYFKENFKIGDDVIYSRLFTPINSIPGHYVSGMIGIGTNPMALGSSNISIAFDEIASLSDVNITIV
jgi:uncharacterized phage protein gp47/JayE